MGATDKRASYTGDSHDSEEGENDAFGSMGHNALLSGRHIAGLAFGRLLSKFSRVERFKDSRAQSYEDDMGQITEGTRLRRGRDGTYDVEVIMNSQVVWRQTGFPTMEAARAEANRRLADLLGRADDNALAL